MLESLKHEDLQFQELSSEEKQARGILARLTGPIASFTKGTRNGRKYSDKLWEKAFDAPLVKEMFKNGGLPGELQHPENRSETDPTKIAIMMPEPPKKDSKGHLVASVDILDTPCGQIAYQLGKYGFKFGISSRGEGDLITDFSGEESVDPDTYTLNAFDLVLIPACEDARLQFNESLNTKKNNKLRTILSEALENASDIDRKIMEEALDELNIDDNWRYVETYEDNDIFFEPGTKKYIVGDLDSYAALNSLKNAKEYIDRYNPEGQLFNAKEYKEEKLNEDQVGREETKPATSASEILKNKPQPEKKVEEQPPEVNVNVQVPEKEEESDEGMNESLTEAKSRKTPGYCYVITFDDGGKRSVMSAKYGFETKEEAIKALADAESEYMDSPFWDDTVKKSVRLIKESLFDNESLTGAIEWNDLNGTEQSAVEAALAEINNGSDIEDAVHGAVARYNEENANPDYEDEDFYMEEANFVKVMEYVRAYTTDTLTEAKFGMFKYVYSVHAHPQGRDIILCGSKTLEGATRMGINQANKIFENPFMSDKEKYQYLETMYMANDDTEEVDVSSEFDEYVDNLMSELQSRIINEGNEETAGLEEGAIVPKKNFELVAKPFSMTMYYKGEETPVESAVVVVPNAIKYHDGTVTDGVVACEDPDTGEVINFKTVDEAQEWIDSFGEDCLYRMDGGTLHAVPKELYDIDKAIPIDESVDIAADNDGAIVEQLQNILKENKSLENKVKALQEKISAGYAKEMSLKEELDNYKQKASKLSEKSKEIKVLKEKLSKAEAIVEDNKSKANDNISTLNESIEAKAHENKTLRKDISVLNEALDKKNSKIKSLNEQISNYKDELRSKDTDIEQLKEQYETGQKDLEQLKNRYSKKLEEQNQTIEKYQRVAKNSVKKYIESQAIRLGVKSDEIVNRLPKNYSFNDIDVICEDLQEYKFNISNLPFGQYSLNENLKVTAKNINKGLVEANPEDEITDYDLKIAEAFL